MLSDFTDDATKMADKRAGIYQTYVMRKAAWPLTYLALKTRIHPVTVTLVGLILGVISSILMAICSTEQLIWAGVLWHVVKILDFVDGNLARALNQKTYAGKMLDGLTDILVNIALLIGLGVHVGGAYVILALALSNIYVLGHFSYFRYNSFHSMMAAQTLGDSGPLGVNPPSPSGGVTLSGIANRLTMLAGRLHCELVLPSVILFALLGRPDILIILSGGLMAIEGVLMGIRALFATLKNLNIQR